MDEGGTIVTFLSVFADATGERGTPDAVGSAPSLVEVPWRPRAPEANPCPRHRGDHDQRSPLIAAQQAVLENRVAHARRLVDSVLELFDGEVVERDGAGLLAADRGALPAGTPVVRRRSRPAVADRVLDDAADPPSQARALTTPVRAPNTPIMDRETPPRQTRVPIASEMDARRRRALAAGAPVDAGKGAGS